MSGLLRCECGDHSMSAQRLMRCSPKWSLCDVYSVSFKDSQPSQQTLRPSARMIVCVLLTTIHGALRNISGLMMDIWNTLSKGSGDLFGSCVAYPVFNIELSLSPF